MARLILGPNQPVIEEIRQAARRHPGGRLRILVAWAREEGALRLLEALGGRINDLQLIVGLNEKNTTVEALLRLLPHVRLLKTFLKHPSQTFHPKLYWFDDGLEPSETTTLIVGSSNLTRGGLVTNFEASLIADIVGPNLREEDLQLLASVAQKWTELLNSPFASVVPGVNRMRELYESGYLVLERTIRRRKRQAVRTEAPLGTLPTAPPPPVQPPLMEPILIPFPLKREDETEPVLGENVDPAGAQPLPDRFFVRTLTDNDIEKLHGRTPGTFEPDLGETARDRFPAFWAGQGDINKSRDA